MSKHIHFQDYLKLIGAEGDEVDVDGVAANEKGLRRSRRYNAKTLRSLTPEERTALAGGPIEWPAKGYALRFPCTLEELRRTLGTYADAIDEDIAAEYAEVGADQHDHVTARTALRTPAANDAPPPIKLASQQDGGPPTTPTVSDTRRSADEEVLADGVLAIGVAKPEATQLHRTKRRTHPLDAVIEAAKRKAENADDYHSVYAALVEIAQRPDRPAPLIGYADGVGVQWRKDGEVEFFKKDSLRKRMNPRAR